GRTPQSLEHDAEKARPRAGARGCTHRDGDTLPPVGGEGRPHERSECGRGGGTEPAKVPPPGSLRSPRSPPTGGREKVSALINRCVHPLARRRGWEPVFGKHHAPSRSQSGRTTRREVIPL